MSIKNTWRALSMRDRAFLIREAVRNGITDIGSIRDTWEHRFDGENNNLSIEDFYKQKQQEAIQAALLKQSARTTHLSPIQAKTEEDKEYDKWLVKKRQYDIRRRIEAELPSYSDYERPIFQSFVKKGAQLQKRNLSRIDEDLEYYTERLKSAEEEASKCTKEGFGCIYQALDNYGKVETSNYNFMQFPEKYGFKSIPVENILPGDLVQFTNGDGYPTHMMMAETPYNKTNENYEGEHMRYSGNAGHELRNNAKYSAPWDSLRAYTFVGNKTDSLQWEKEYREKYGHQFSGEEDQDSNSIKLPFLEGVKIPLFSQVLDSASSKYLQDITSPKVPYKHSTEEPSHYQRDILHQDIAGISDVTQKVKFGDGDLYLYNGETEDEDPNSMFLKAKNLPYFYKVEKRYLDSVPMEHFDVIPQKDLRKYMPKRDYIGSNAKSTAAQNEEVREKVAKLIPGFTDSLSVIANRHNINPALMYRRISKEGYLDHEARLYNEVIPSIQQKNFFDEVADQEVSGFNDFGLDDIRDVLESNQLKLTKPVQWRPDENVRYNEKDRRVYSVYFPTLWDAMEVKAAELARRKEIMKARGYSGRDLDIWTNASYNLGTEHEDLNDTEWIRKTYSFPDYSHLFKK